ncbi:O-methyltransferase [Lentzea sp. HUAS12]|uniref:O-methyltransferase n=1 Tax=Lentzea sp. HUAS12 TaxID=2951806 RepID=UPI00209D43FD|nr:O-methyltransferase [Lentzea sp. HUAS12]USX55490.1 O-methyltransferase [Lentzea sp. HUAS12]
MSVTLNGATQVDKRIQLTPEILDYVLACTEQPTPVQQRLIDATSALGQVAEMQIAHEQAVLFTLLAAASGARRIVEVGTFTGYSALAFAKGMPADGTIDTYDITDRWAPTARRAWQEAGFADRIRQHVGPAADLLDRLPLEPAVDLVFIDADKVSYIGYWEQLLPRVVENGLIIADNVLYAGEATSAHAEGNAAAIRAFNEHVRADDRVQAVMLPLADGLTIARKLPAGYRR